MSGYSDMFDSMSSEDTFSILNSTSGQMSRSAIGARIEVPALGSPQEDSGKNGPSLEAGLPSPPSSRSSSKSSASPPSRSKSAESYHSKAESENSKHSSLLRAKSEDSMNEEEERESDIHSSKAPSSHQSKSPASSGHSTPHRSVSSSSRSLRSASSSSRSAASAPPLADAPTTLERKPVGEEQPRVDESSPGSASPGSRSFSPGGTMRKKHMFSKYPDLATSSSRSPSSSSGTPVSRSSSASLHSVAKSIDNSRIDGGKGSDNSSTDKNEAPNTTAVEKESTKTKKGGASKAGSSKVPDIRANNHQPSPVPKKSVAPKPGSAGVKTLRASPATNTSPRRTPSVATTAATTPQPSPTNHQQEEKLFRAVPPRCRNILMGMVNANSESDDSDDAFAVPHRPDPDTPAASTSVAVIEDKSADTRGVDKAGEVQASSHYPRQPRVTSARQKYLNSIDMTFLVSAPLLGSGRVGRKLNPATKAPPPSPASVSPRSTRSRPTTGSVKPKPKPSSSNPPPPQQIEDTAASQAATDSSLPAESPEWTVDNKTGDATSTATSTRSPARSTDKHQQSNSNNTGTNAKLKKSVWRVIPLNYLSTLHEAAEQRREKREKKLEEEEEKKEAAKKEHHVKIVAPSERLYSKGAVPKYRMERYRELAREAGEDFIEDSESLTASGVDNDNAASRNIEGGARLNAAKWVLTRTVASPGGGATAAPAYGTQYDTTTQILHLRPRENDEVFDRLSTIKKSKSNPYKDVQIGGKPLDPLSEEGLGELNDRMYGRWVERKEKEKQVKEEKEAAAKAKPTKKVSAEEIADRMYAQPVEMKAKKLEVLRKKQDDEIKRLARTIDVGGKASPRQAPATVSLKSVSQRQYYEPMAKKAAWRETMLKTLADEDKKASVSKGPIDSSRWDEIIERNVYEVQAKRPPTASTAVPAPPKSTPKKTGRTRPQTAQ